MSNMHDTAELRYGDAIQAAAILAVDPAGVGGLRLRARFGATRTAWLAGLQRLLGQRPSPRIAPTIDDACLFGGLDLAATLATGRAIHGRGLLSSAHGGVAVLPMAERMSEALGARIALAQETGCIVASSHQVGETGRRFGLLALDEGVGPDERPPAVLIERLAIQLELDELPHASRDFEWPVAEADITGAEARLPEVVVDHETIEALCHAAASLGIVSMRAPAQAIAVARVAAALDGRVHVAADDIAVAVRLVLAPRALRLPEAEPEQNMPDDASPDSQSEPDADPAGQREEGEGEETPAADAKTEGAGSTPEMEEEQGADLMPDEQALAAAAARLPAGLLDSIAEPAESRIAPTKGGGRRGAAAASGRRGRPTGVRPGMPDDRHRLNVTATLRAAAPWQSVRGRSLEDPRLRLRRDDFRVTRYEQPRETATLFVVDVSGSAALSRLAEAKGAVELLLADCYIRRDRVGLIAFRGQSAETSLAPTRSLVNARRRLAGLVGGGGTPLAAGLDVALVEAERALRDGATPTLVVLTDGRGNIARSGAADRAAARRDAHAAAGEIAQAGHAALVIDISPRPRSAARELADAMNARYLALPAAGAEQLSDAVRAEIS